jgi:hypothetical protein
MVKRPNRAFLGPSWLGVVVLMGGAASCVVYTPELLDQDAVSLGRSTPTATSSPASPALRELRPSFDKETSPNPGLAFVITPAESTAPLEAELSQRTVTDGTAQADGGATDAGSDAEVSAAL